MIARFLLLIGCLSAAANSRVCAPLPAGERARLVEYVRKKNNLPKDADLKVNELAFAEGTCFRRVEFKSEGRGFRSEMYLSPDFRFLTRELLDSTVDPVREEHRRRQALAAGLGAAHSPSLGPRNASVTIAVFSDFQCPYCARLARMLRTEVLPAKKNTRLIFRHFPLSTPRHTAGGRSRGLRR